MQTSKKFIEKLNPLKMLDSEQSIIVKEFLHELALQINIWLKTQKNTDTTTETADLSEYVFFEYSEKLVRLAPKTKRFVELKLQHRGWGKLEFASRGFRLYFQ